MSEVLHTLRERGFIQQVSDEPGLAALLSRGPVTYYAGFDPTKPALQLGNAVPLMAMAHLARAGHRPIVVVGGGTTMIGDPSGKTEMRQLISAEEIAANIRAIEPQVRRYLDVGGHGGSIVVNNADWLLPLNYIEFLRDIGRHFSVNRMLAAEAYKVRLEKGLSFIEFNYQILQAYDFLVLHRKFGCTLQIGGDDQWGNILAGTDLIRRLEQKEAYALTFPLIMTAAGVKMGKTAKGAVWLGEGTSPFELYQYFVNVDDRDVVRFLKLFTFLPMAEIDRLAALQGAEVREAKRTLAFHATAIVHGDAAAEQAAKGAEAAFGGGASAELVPTHTVTALPLKIVDLLVDAGLAASKSAARRLIEQGGVRLGDVKITTIEDAIAADLIPADGILLHAGKKNLRRIVTG